MRRSLAFLALIVLGMVAIGWLIWTFKAGDLAASIFGSAFGALAAVWGGQFLSDYRSAQAKRELAGILSSIVFKINSEAESLGMVHMPESSSMDPDIEKTLRQLEARRKQLIRFRPYRALADLTLIEMISDLDAYCEVVTAVLKSPSPGPDIQGREGNLIPQRYRIIETQQAGDTLSRMCQETLATLGLPWDHKKA